jgi:hypothetical protein
MSRRRRRDDHGVDPGIAEDRLDIRGGRRAMPRGYLARRGPDGIIDDSQLGRWVRGQRITVDAPDPPRADRTLGPAG